MSIAIVAQSLRKAGGLCPLLTLCNLFCTASVEGSTDRWLDMSGKPIFLLRDNILSMLVTKACCDLWRLYSRSLVEEGE